jgi:maltose-binding protein MalE
LIPKTDAGRETHAWHFVHWLLAQEQTAQWAQDTEEFPARVSAINSMDADKLPPHFFEAIQRVGARTQAEPLLAAWPCVADVLASTALDLAVSRSLTETLESAQSAAATQLGADCPVR